MKALFCHDTYYTRGADGAVYAHGAFPYRLWKERYLPHFSHITVIGRAWPGLSPATMEGLDRADGPHVDFVPLPNINTPLKRLFGAGEVRQKIAEEIAKADALIVRGPAEFGMIAAKAARARGKPCAVTSAPGSLYSVRTLLSTDAEQCHPERSRGICYGFGSRYTTRQYLSVQMVCHPERSEGSPRSGLRPRSLTSFGMTVVWIYTDKL